MILNYKKLIGHINRMLNIVNPFSEAVISSAKNIIIDHSPLFKVDKFTKVLFCSVVPYKMDYYFNKVKIMKTYQH